MTKIVVYDLNETLYHKSSKDEFFKFICYKKGYKLPHLFQLTALKFLNNIDVIGKTFFKENFYNYLDNMPPEKIEKYAEQFWGMEYPDYFHKSMVADIKKHHKEGTLVYIITGGFEVYTKYLEKILPVEVHGTRTSYKNGTYKVIGEACNGKAKVKRLNEVAPADYRLIKAYSDDKEPILYEAEKAYYVDDGEVMPLESASD
ncbi:HAD family hydrolase [Fulvivirga sediminis]|uniref:Haloacid dehalogenase-like hydrolase n=1 Tax=Fulvivirga sediminis TaxID=2803949 RepID=A0A937K1A5_9BACT|nr:HAD family hydrolase [Fulvivirga sediminis]MBL3657145.1 haloacid dehalogenase-like hydrolase [Fulvivirga sediminis]